MITHNRQIYQEGKAWGYRFDNIKNGMWYYGAGPKDKSPDDYNTGSENVELLSAISRGEIERTIICADDSYDNILTWENNILVEKDAKNNPMSYNGNNGMVANKQKPNPKLMKAVADEIIEHNSLGDINAFEIDLTYEVERNKKSKLKPNSIYNNLVFWQGARQVKIITDHKNRISENTDKYFGNIDDIKKYTGQDMLMVILEDRLYEGRRVPLVIGGNHTWHGILHSQFGFRIKCLRITRSVHERWSDLDVRQLSTYLNPRNRKITLETNEDDAVKTCVEILKDTNESMTEVTSFLNEESWTSKEKTRIKRRAKNEFDKQKEEKNIPKNFIEYKTEEEKQLIKDKVKEYEGKNTLVKVMSTGKASIGDPMTKVFHEIYNGETRLEKIVIILYHPSPAVYKIFKEKWEQYFPTWQKLAKNENVELKWVEMDHEIDE